MKFSKGNHIFILAVAGVLSAQTAFAASKASPSLNLLPKDYDSYANEVSNVTREMGGSIEQHLATITKQSRFYKGTCGDSPDIEDKGCAAAREAVVNSYIEVLNVVGDNLPVMTEKMKQMHRMLKTSVRKNVGSQTLATLMEMASGKGTARETSRRVNKNRKRSVAAVGQKLQKLLKLEGGGPAFAAEEFLYLEDAIVSLDGLKAAIESQRAYVSLNKQVMMITPEMELVVSELDAIIHPENADIYEDEMTLPQTSNEWD